MTECLYIVCEYITFFVCGWVFIYYIEAYKCMCIYGVDFWFTFGYNLKSCRKYFRHWNDSGPFPRCHSVVCAGQWKIKIYFHCLTENNEVHLSGFSYVMREMFTLEQSLTPPKCAMMKSIGTQKQHILWQECMRSINVQYDKSLLEWINLVIKKEREWERESIL